MSLNENYIQEKNQITIAIHSTDNSFGFALREKNKDNFFIRKFENDLCNNLIVDLKHFISKENLKKIDKISVSIGPGNFNASRLIIVLARTLSQQINCPLKSFSSFELMSKRIALRNNLYSNNQSFWIYKKLKRRGFIAGKYKVNFSKEHNGVLDIKEKVIPKVIQKLDVSLPNFEAKYDDKEDLRELLNLSNKNLELSKSDSWKKVFPLYPLSPIN